MTTRFRTPSIRALSLIGALTAAVAFTACSDTSATAPDRTLDQLRMSPATHTNGSIDFKTLYPKLSKQVPSRTMKGDTTIQKFTVNPPDGKLIEFGKNSGNVIAIPPNTLCSPTANSYGPTEWQNPCIHAKSSISFEVRSWKDAMGVPHADFLPKIRFSPTAAAPVVLYFQAPMLNDFTSVYIPYCNALNICVNEGRTDAALETYVAPLNGGGYWVYRTLRHFSGYTVVAD